MQLIRRWATATFILCFLVIIAGGVVRTTQSGMGCPDWPRCFGQWIPPTDASQLPADFEKYLDKQDIDHTFNAFHTWIEYINRLLGVLLGLFAIIQVALLFSHRKTAKRSWQNAIAFLIIVIITGLFGALVVKYNLAHLSISVHLFFAVLLLQVQLVLWLRLKSTGKVFKINQRTKSLLWVFAGILLLQFVLGTMVRIHVDDISKSLDYTHRNTWLNDETYTFLMHRSFSWAVTILALWLAWSQRNALPGLRWQFFALATTIGFSMITGITLYLAGMPAAAQPLHLLLATIAITQTTALLLQSRTNTINAD
jgi:heme a synthase